ncbi:MAG: ABC transporter substrate-binding protein [Myxococcota bacterium]|nr:ABC transporter substrate-binding protein [Myxococcota bacterium]
MVKHFLLASFSLLLMVTQGWAGPPTDSLKAKVSEARQLLKQKVVDGSEEAKKVDAKLKSVIEPVLDFQRMSENALRAHWSNLTPGNRTEFVALFRALLFRSYLTRIRKANEDYTLQYEGEEAKGRKAAAVTVIAQTPKAEIELVFHVITQDGKKWITEDVVIDEVSLVQNYREQFTRIIKKDGYPVLLKKMADKLRELGGEVPVEVKSIPKSTEVKSKPTTEEQKNTGNTAKKRVPTAPQK